MPEEEAFIVKIVDVVKVPSAEVGREGKYDYVVSYQDAAGRMRIINVPAEEVEAETHEKMLENIAAFIRKAEAFRKFAIGREIKI